VSITNTPHLNFRGNARQALEFYHSVFGGQLMIATYGQFGLPRDDPDGGPVTFGPVAGDSPDADRVAFGVVAGDSGFRVAAYDVFGATGGGIAGSSAQTARRAGGLTHDEPFFLLLNGDTIDEISVLWDKLAVGATVIASLATAQSAALSYGMLTDRFGVTWIFGVTPAH
jgi:PhnB protein